jgi:hypothetical protein
MVGRGAIRRSDILFSVPSDRRTLVLAIVEKGGSLSRQEVLDTIKRKGVSIPEVDVEVVLRYGDSSHAFGDMYDDVRAIEMGLHDLIKKSLQKAMGTDDNGWWREGIPKNIRKKCAERREDDDGELAPDPYCYTDLIDLREILDKQWTIISADLPKVIVNNRKAFLGDLLRLNGIRRKVMHPVRGDVPSEQDFEFLRDLRCRLGNFAVLD